MLNTKLLSDEELRKLFSEPLSEEEAKTMHEANEEARSFLATSLREMKSPKTTPDENPDKDPNKKGGKQ